jgi:putative lipoic acid-binding regulatory protein
MADESDSPLEFPCRYPVKAMVRTSAEARTAVLTAISRHTEFSHRADVRVRPSRNGRFESITVTVEATSREHLESIYEEVRALDFVVMML